MARFTAKQIQDLIRSSSTDDDDEQSDASSSAKSEPKIKNNMKKKHSDVLQNKPEHMEVDESDQDESKVADSQDDKESEEQDDNSGSEELEGNMGTQTPGSGSLTPVEASKRRRNRSPMNAQNSGGESDESEEWPTINVRKSLRFEELSVEKKRPEPSPLRIPSTSKLQDPMEEPTMMEETTLNLASESENEKDDFPTGEVFMDDFETNSVIKTLTDPWKKRKNWLMETHENKFTEWQLALGMKMNILVYGVGSKKNLLERFRELELNQEASLVVNGFDSDCDLKMVFCDFLEKITGSTPSKYLDEMVEELESCIADRYENFNLILHSIDGPRLRNSAAQRLLCKFAQIPKARIIAIWSQDDLDHFHWIYYHMSTFVDYNEYSIPDLSVKGGKNLSLLLTSLYHVFKSLTANAKSIFKEIAKYQVENDTDKAANEKDLGMPYNHLYKICRSEFFVSSDAALRKQLVEFYDHELLRTKRGPDGLEYLKIPTDSKSLKSFLENPDE